MRFKKGDTIPTKDSVFAISSESFVKAYLKAIKLDPNQTFGKLKEGNCFLKQLLKELGIEIDSGVPRSLQFRLRNKFVQCKSLINEELSREKGIFDFIFDVINSNVCS